jgi:hypothetical protein
MIFNLQQILKLKTTGCFVIKRHQKSAYVFLIGFLHLIGGSIEGKRCILRVYVIIEFAFA